jgi:hypothetical protein
MPAGFCAVRRLRLRHAPRLEFIFDDTADKASRLTGLIDRAVKHDQAGHVDEPGRDPEPGHGRDPGES